ncbi:Homeobox-leucine zipper protein HDG11 [Linum perenne]
MEFSNAGGGGNGGGGAGSGDHDSSSDVQMMKKKKKYHRHTVAQIQKLEAMFKECPHPDEKQRLYLSRELGLSPRQIKFWFQNRRTQMKAQHERADNCALRAENDKIRCENIAIREALRNVICPSCGGPPVNEDSYFDEHKLRIENAQLKEELDRVSSIAAKYIGRPISHLPPVQPIHVSSLDLSMASFGGHGMGGGQSSLDLDFDLLPQQQSSQLPLGGISSMDKSMMMDVAGNAVEELLRLLRSDEQLWIDAGGREVLNLENYQKMFPKPNDHLKNPNVRIEASRDAGVVIMNGLSLVDMFMDAVSSYTLKFNLHCRFSLMGFRYKAFCFFFGSAEQVMYEELQMLSPLVPTREFYILRYCQQIEQGVWAVVNVSYDIPQFASQFRSHRLPSGCLIEDMPNGYSKVTWVDHVEVEDTAPIHRLYRDLIYSGMAFGAERWLTTLQRMCERYACLMVSNTSTRDLGVIPSPEGKRSMMKLAQRMVSSFCSSISTSNSHQWTTLSGLNDVGVRVTLRKSTDPGQPNGVVLSAATTFWLPVSPQNVFNFFKDEKTRSQWDVLSSGNGVQEVAHIANGSHPGNCISVLRVSAFNTSQNNMLILQESCIDSSGSLVVYCPVELQAINIAMSGEDPSCIPLLPSGFTICPDGNLGASTSSGTIGKSTGSLITVAFQILVSSLPSAKLNMESVTTVNSLISTTVQQIKAALNCCTTSS